VICPSGHQTNQADFCDVCGLPISDVQADASAGSSTPAASDTLLCPNCQATNVAEALFCEACGFDFTTAASEPEWPKFNAAPQSGELPESSEVPEFTEATVPSEPTADQGSTLDTASSLNPVATTQPAIKQTRPRVDWVAELWIDPDWYAAQRSTDPMPSVGLPDIVPLVKQSNLIGRVSHTKGVFPEIDCELDSGCSRRHAILTTDWTRWWIEDLTSANGTFVGGVAGPLPAMPIPQGRVELTSGQRIYVGAWTRIVIRKATADEQDAFA
jgi:hypothetical protein